MQTIMAIQMNNAIFSVIFDMQTTTNQRRPMSKSDDANEFFFVAADNSRRNDSKWNSKKQHQSEWSANEKRQSKAIWRMEKSSFCHIFKYLM